MKKIVLGAIYRDKVTGFEGTAVAETRYITGCNRVMLEPKAKEDGSLAGEGWFDLNRLERNESAMTVLVLETEPADAGGPRMDPPAR